MAPSRRQISGRSPLVNQQRQITAFFGKPSASSSSPSPSPAPVPSFSIKKTPKSNPSPSSPSPSPSPPKKTPKLNPTSKRSPSPGPATPSPVQCKLKKPLLVIGQTPSPPQLTEITYGNEVVGKQVRVYWPLDKRWYDGSVISYDRGEGKHLVEYDDGEEESLVLAKEKIEWVVGAKSGDTFKRLRRGASAFRKVMTDSDDDMEEEKENKSDGDDSSDEDWGKNMGNEVCESEEDDVELDDENEMAEDEQVEEIDEESPSKLTIVSKTDSRKRKTSEVTKSGGEKKSRTDKDITLKSFKATVVEPVKKIEEGKPKSLFL